MPHILLHNTIVESTTTILLMTPAHYFSIRLPHYIVYFRAIYYVYVMLPEKALSFVRQAPNYIYLILLSAYDAK